MARRAFVTFLAAATLGACRAIAGIDDVELAPARDSGLVQAACADASISAAACARVTRQDASVCAFHACPSGDSQCVPNEVACEVACGAPCD